MIQSNTQTQKPEAWVVFSGQADLPWLRVLKPGFRHCYVMINDGKHWISIDPLSSYTDIAVHHLPQDFDLPRWMQKRGHMIVKAPISKVTRPAPWMVFTCVEAVKRVLGIHRRMIITPWQLYRHLMQTHQYSSKTIKGDLAWEA
ncbi:MAG: hypothetical protein ACPGRX_00925 [Bdellovibrionales bacterium]